jgi:hypothetical protein
MSPRARNSKRVLKSSEIGELERGRVERRHADWLLPMSERLARVHEVSKQMNEIKGAASER